MLSRRKFLQGSAVLAAAPAMVWPSQASAQAPARRSSQVPGYYRLMVGDVEVTAVYDGQVNVPVSVLQGAKPKEIAALLEYGFTDPKADIPVAVNTFLLNTGSNLVLVDTGGGTFFGPSAGLLAQNIRAAGYAPEDVDTILFTHLHMDHALGIVDGANQPIFPRAVLRVAQAEADYWLSDAYLSIAPERMKPFLRKLKESLAPYQASGRFKTFATGEATVAGIEAVPLPGHTPGHHGFRVSSKGQGFLAWGDTMHNAAVQFTRPDVTFSFDVDAPWARSTRQTLLPGLGQGANLGGRRPPAVPGRRAHPGQGQGLRLDSRRLQGAFGGMSPGLCRSWGCGR